MSRFVAASLVSMAAVAGVARADVLWDQSAINLNIGGYPNVIAGSPPFGVTAYTVADVTVPAGGWTVTSVSMYFTNFNFDWADNVTQGRLNIFSKSGSMPTSGNNPGTGTLVPMTFTDQFDETYQQGYYKLTASGLSTALAPGQYWIGITPVTPSGPFGPEFGLAAATTIGDYSPYRSPFSGPGDPPANTWTNVSGNQDAAILVEGTTVPAPGALALLGIGGLVAARRRRN